MVLSYCYKQSQEIADRKQAEDNVVQSLSSSFLQQP